MLDCKSYAKNSEDDAASSPMSKTELTAAYGLGEVDLNDSRSTKAAAVVGIP